MRVSPRSWAHREYGQDHLLEGGTAMLKRVFIEVLILVVVRRIDEVVILFGDDEVGARLIFRQPVALGIAHEDGMPLVALKVAAVLVSKRRRRVSIADDFCGMQAANGPMVARDDHRAVHRSEVAEGLVEP